MEKAICADGSSHILPTTGLFGENSQGMCESSIGLSEHSMNETTYVESTGISWPNVNAQ